MTVAEVKALILSCCEAGRSASRLPQDLPDGFDLRAEGVVDSLGFIELLSELEARLGRQIDVAELDLGDLTRFGPLARHIAERL